MIDYTLLAIQNPWWQDKRLIEKDDKIEEFRASKAKYTPQEILNLKLKKEAVNIVSGPRQTGKTTAIKLLIKSLLEKEITPETIFYFNCDALESRKDIIDLVLSFLEGIKDSSGKIPQNYLFLDEISSVADWPYAIKWLVDSDLLTNSKIILSGSSSISLKKSGEFLPGRRKGGRDIRFLPISFWEYLKIVFPDFPAEKPVVSFEKLGRLQKHLVGKRMDLKGAYKEFLLTGGFLKMIDLFIKGRPFSEGVELYKSTVKSELAKFGKGEIYARRILAKIIDSLASETSYANVAEEAELGSKNTAADYLSFFSDSFLLIETLFYSISQKRVIVKKNKKYYPTDPFLFWIFNAFVSGSSQIEGFYQRYFVSPLDSRIAEAFVASELYKQGLEFYFFKNAKELDFYIPKLELGIEVKYKQKISSFDLEGLKYAKKKLVVSRNTLETRNGTLIVPAHLFGLVNLEEI